MAGGSPTERLNLLNLAGHAPKLAISATTLVADGSTLAWSSEAGAFNLVTGSTQGGGAPAGAAYVTLALSAGLAAERVLAAGAGLTLLDAGAGGTVTLEVGVPGQAAGDLLLRTGQGWGRLAGATAGYVLAAQGAGEVPTYVPQSFHQPMVWCGQHLATKRDGVVVLAAVPWSPMDYPAGRKVKVQAVLSSPGPQQVRVRLYNATDAEYVTGAVLQRTGGTPATVTSAALTIGTQAGNLRTTSRIYELHADILDTQALDDIGVVGFAGLRIE